MVIRLLRPADGPAAAALAAAAFPQHTWPARQEHRVAHFLAHDPGGAWAAEEDGELTGVALAVVREGLWGLSLLVVRADRQGQGVGRRLLDAALVHGAPHRGGVILSSQDPKAMRRYARAGFTLLPAVAAGGVVARPPAPVEGVRAVGVDEAVPVAGRAGRAVRGAGYARSDLELLVARGATLLVLGDEGLAAHEAGSPALLAAADEEVAAALLRACLAAAPGGATVDVEAITAGQMWAIDTCLDAGLALSPWGPVFVRGELGPLRPWLPSGAVL